MNPISPPHSLASHPFSRSSSSATFSIWLHFLDLAEGKQKINASCAINVSTSCVSVYLALSFLVYIFYLLQLHMGFVQDTYLSIAVFFLFFFQSQSQSQVQNTKSRSRLTRSEVSFAESNVPSTLLPLFTRSALFLCWGSHSSLDYES